MFVRATPKIFTTLLEYMCIRINWNTLGININSKMLNYLKFANDIILISEYIENAKSMLERLNEAYRKVDLKINIQLKIKLTRNLVLKNMSIDGSYMKQVASYKYLSHEVEITKHAISRRIRSTWTAFGKLRYILKSELPMCLNRKIFNQ